MAAIDAFAVAREQFAAWRKRYPENPFKADRHLDVVNRRYLDDVRLDRLREAGTRFGNLAPSLAAAIELYQSRPPELDKYDGAGNPIEAVRFADGYHDAGRIVWGSGLLRRALEPGNSFEQANFMYLLSLEGEMGHMCAATCTTGLIRVLRRNGSQELQDRYLPALTDLDYDRADRGAQFLTEVQGGSDVGAIASEVTAVGDGTHRITGEKWFCSAADADLFLLLARPPDSPPGTAGLACFLVPREVDGRPNGFSIRRLKDKLGTTSMASAEIDFTDSLAYLVGGLDEGFKIMVTAMLNSSRWLNAIGDVGIMRRAYLEAANYAAVRTAFGRRIGDFPLVRSQLARIKAEWLAALHSTWALTELDEAVDLASGGNPIEDAEVGFHRYLVNANKLGCALAATSTVGRAIEVLGGNGTIEDFSVLPRLLRDAVVYEQWEGTHNVLTAQVLRDIGKLGLAGIVIDLTAVLLKGIGDDDLALVGGRAEAALEDLAGGISRSLEDPEFGSLHFRTQLERLLRTHQVALLLDAAASEEDSGLAAELTAAATLLTGEYLDPGYRSEDDPRHLRTVDRLLGDDLTA
jgi:alkylation response protein AidB-like acyl-CoA dehydrogenase